MKYMMNKAGNDLEVHNKIKISRLIGVEQRVDIRTHACSNMMMREAVKIDPSNWKGFIFGNLFEVVYGINLGPNTPNELTDNNRDLYCLRPLNAQSVYCLFLLSSS